MYPPVALNQYTWVNRTDKQFFIYASRPHANFEIDSLESYPPNNMLNMEVIWWKFVINFLIFGGPGEPYVESRGTKVSWRPHHTGDITTTKKNNR